MDNSNLMFLNFSVERQTMKFEVEKPYGKDYYYYFDEDNDFCTKLEYLADHCALHNAILSSKVDGLCGLGLTSDDEDTIQGLTRANEYESWDELYRKIANDLVLYGGYSLELIYGKGHKKITDVYHIPFRKLRIGDIDDYGNVKNVWYSNDWANYRKKDYIPKRMEAYSKDSKSPSQVLYVKPYRSGEDVYPLPTYIGALDYIQIDCEVAKFHLAHIQNGMFPSVMISFVNGNPTMEEKKKIQKQFEDKFQGAERAGNFILNFSDGKDKEPTIMPITQPDLDKMFIELNNMVLQNILSGHKVVSPMLVGIKTEGQLGGAAELQNAFEIYSKTVIDPLKELILKPINKIFATNGYQEVYVETSSPIKFTWSETILKDILTKDELRREIGYEAIEAQPVAPVSATQSNITE